jgi:hypothetical protein
VGRGDADPAAWQRARGGDLGVAAAVDDVVEAHPEAVKASGDGRRPEDLGGAEVSRDAAAARGDGAGVGRENQRAQPVGDGGEHQRHPSELEQRQQALGNGP